MMKMPAVLGFTALTFFSWGTYGVLLHHGQADMKAMLKPFVFVGVAYFFIAVLFPGIMLTRKNEKGSWSFMGSMLSFFAGAVGALGALGIIMAMNFGGKPIYVMPFVFGLAPVVNTLVTATINKTFDQIKVPFIIGLALVILGAVGVLVSKGLTSSKASEQKTAYSSPFTQGIPLTPIALQEKEQSVAPEKSTEIPSVVTASNEATTTTTPEKKTNMIGVIMSMIMAAFCWGAYGPVLHIGQMKMGGSRLRPFVCVGLAYFFIAVALPLVLIQMGLDGGSWEWKGAVWSTAAGALGAFGALGIIYAFNFGGKPIFVMPLVFGFAPIINTVVSMSEAGTLGQISPLFVGALATTIAGAVMVLVFQPSGKPHGKAATPAAPPAAKPNADSSPGLQSHGSAKLAAESKAVGASTNSENALASDHSRDSSTSAVSSSESLSPNSQSSVNTERDTPAS